METVPAEATVEKAGAAPGRHILWFLPRAAAVGTLTSLQRARPRLLPQWRSRLVPVSHVSCPLVSEDCVVFLYLGTK